MKQLNDKELHELVGKWDVPKIPPSLTENVLQQYRNRTKWSWRWLITGSLRIPVPVASLTMLIILCLVIVAIKQTTPAPSPSQRQIVNRIIEIPVNPDSVTNNTVYPESPPHSAVTGHFNLSEFQPVASLAPRIVRRK
jgi:hypothetical protein